MLDPILASLFQERIEASAEMGHKGEKGIEKPDLGGEAERAGAVQPGDEKAQGNLIYVCKYLIGESKKQETRFCFVISNDKEITSCLLLNKRQQAQIKNIGHSI